MTAVRLFLRMIVTENDTSNSFSELGMTLISVGHRKSLKNYHHWLLELGVTENGGWNLRRLENV